RLGGAPARHPEVGARTQGPADLRRPDRDPGPRPRGHPHAAHQVVDTALRGPMLNPKIRVRTREGRVISNVDVPAVVTPVAPAPAPATPTRPLGIFPYGVSRHHVEQSIRDLDLPVRVLGNLDGAGAVLTLKNHYRRRPDSL